MIFHLEKALAEADDQAHERKPAEKESEQTDEDSHSGMDNEPGSLPLDQLLRPHQLHATHVLCHDDAEHGCSEWRRHHDRRFEQKSHRLVTHFEPFF